MTRNIGNILLGALFLAITFLFFTFRGCSVPDYFDPELKRIDSLKQDSIEKVEKARTDSINMSKKVKADSIKLK
jgi:hypothetical protein